MKYSVVMEVELLVDSDEYQGVIKEKVLDAVKDALESELPENIELVDLDLFDFDEEPEQWKTLDKLKEELDI